MLLLKSSKNEISIIHKIFIADEEFIFDVFEQIIDELIFNPNSCVSLIYTNSNKIPPYLLDQGLRFLEERFSDKLLIYKVPKCYVTNCIDKENLKPIIKSNSSKELKFYLFGKNRFVFHLSQTLIFLGIKSDVITKLSNTHFDEN